MFTLALADSVLFLYGVIPIYLIFLTIMVENTNRTGFATFTLVSILVLMQIFTDIHPFTYVLQYPINTIIAIFIYLLIGIVYVWFKWSSFVGMAVRAISASLAKERNNKPIDFAYYLGYRSIPLRVSDYKYKIISWMAYWPLSLIWTLLNDPLRRLYETIYNRLASSLQAISNKAFADIIDKNNSSINPD